MKLEDEKLIRQYLLGELDEQGLTQVETRIMTDDDFDSKVQLIEDELVEEYVCRELNEQERGRFEQIFLATPAGREKVDFTTAFRTHITRMVEPEPTPPIIIQTVDPEPVPPLPEPIYVSHSWRDALAAFWKYQKPLAIFSLATIALLLISSVWLAIKVQNMKARLNEVQAQQAASQSEVVVIKQQLDDANAKAAKVQNDLQAINEEKNKLVQEIASLKKTEKKTGEPASLGDSVFALVLSPGGDRSSGTETLATLTPDKKTLQLSLKVIDDIFKSFRAKISKRDSSAVMFEIAPSQVRKVDSETLVILQIPTMRFADGEYRINLTGKTSDGKTEPVGRYFFSVRKTP
jgi:hypothetical protein